MVLHVIRIHGLMRTELECVQKVWDGICCLTGCNIPRLGHVGKKAHHGVRRKTCVKEIKEKETFTEEGTANGDQ